MKKKKVISDAEFWRQSNELIRELSKHEKIEVNNKEYILQILKECLESLNPT